MLQGWYEVDEVAQLTGLKPSSIRRYAHETTLIRGVDFTTRRRYRFGRQNQKLVFSKRGLERILTRDFDRLTIRKTAPRPVRDIIEHLQQSSLRMKRLGAPQSLEGILRRRQINLLRLARWLLMHPCRTEACHCACHDVGAPDNQAYPHASHDEENTHATGLTIL